jgi:hypothetical protein
MNLLSYFELIEETMELSSFICVGTLMIMSSTVFQMAVLEDAPLCNQWQIQA